MNAEQLTQLKALLGGTVPESELAALVDRYTGQATKTAEAHGLRFKTQGQQVYTLPDGSPAIIVDGNLIALKHAGFKAAGEGDPPAETEEEAELPEAEADEEDEEEGAYAGDMSIKEFEGLITKAVSAAIGGMGSELKALNTRLNMAEKMGAMMEEMKGYMTGTAQKDATRAQQVEALTQQLTEVSATATALKAQLAELMGDAPASVTTASSSAITTAPVETGDKFTVKTPGQQPVYRNPADGIGAWLEGVTS